MKAEKAAGALKTAMSPDVRVLIRDGEDDPLFIWVTLQKSFIQQRTAPHFNAYHALLSVQKSESESLEGLINRVDEHIRVIKSLSPSSFTLANLYDELAVMAIIRALPHSFDDIVRTISVLDKFDKQSVIQSLRYMDQTRINLSGTSTAFYVHPASQKAPQRPSQAASTPFNRPLPPPHLLSRRIGVITLNATSALALVTVSQVLPQGEADASDRLSLIFCSLSCIHIAPGHSTVHP
jgi:hypothetical protein